MHELSAIKKKMKDVVIIASLVGSIVVLEGCWRNPRYAGGIGGNLRPVMQPDGSTLFVPIDDAKDKPIPK
jgi:hypothetical protein